MEHAETGEGEVPQNFYIGGSVEEIDNAIAYEYDMNGGDALAGTEDCHVTPLESLLPASMPVNKPARVKRVAHRGTAFTKDEDKVLCSAFLNVGKGPITGGSQNLDGYYKRIHDYYQERKPEGSVRSQISLQKRWSIIQKAVSKFCALKSAVDRKNESAKNEYERIEDAVQMYEKTEPFQFMHCWKILRDQAKWHEKLSELSAPKVARVATAATPSPQNVNDNAQVERPEVRNWGKRRRTREDTASSSATVEVLLHDGNKNVKGKQDRQIQKILSMKGDKIQLTQKMFDLQKQDIEVRSKLKAEQLNINKQQLRLTKQDIEVRAKQSEAQLLTAEVGIMGADLEKLSPVVRSYYVTMQRQILERRGIVTPESTNEP